MENDPRYFQLIQMAKAYRVPLSGNQQATPLENRVSLPRGGEVLPRVGEGQQTPVLFNGDQLHQLRAQIMAYKLLGRNQAVPEHILVATTGKAERKFLPPYVGGTDTQLAAAPDADIKQPSLDCKENVCKASVESEKEHEPPPLNIEKQMLQSRVVDPKQLLKSTQEMPQSKLLPVVKLPGLDPTDVVREREHR